MIEPSIFHHKLVDNFLINTNSFILESTNLSEKILQSWIPLIL